MNWAKAWKEAAKELRLVLYEARHLRREVDRLRRRNIELQERLQTLNSQGVQS